MWIRSALVVFLLFVITSCTRPDSVQVEVIADAPGAYPGSELGVTVDENLQVVDLGPQGAASLAGIQVGDTLIDLTLVEMRDKGAMASDNILIESPMPTPTATIEAAPLPTEAGIDNDTVVSATLPSEGSIDPVASKDTTTTPEVVVEAVPFTDRAKVRELIGLGATVKLRVKRGGEVIEVTLQTTPRAPRPNSPTPTVVAPPYDYF